MSEKIKSAESEKIKSEPNETTKKRAPIYKRHVHCDREECKRYYNKVISNITDEILKQGVTTYALAKTTGIKRQALDMAMSTNPRRQALFRMQLTTAALLCSALGKDLKDVLPCASEYFNMMPENKNFIVKGTIRDVAFRKIITDKRFEKLKKMLEEKKNSRPLIFGKHPEKIPLEQLGKGAFDRLCKECGINKSELNARISEILKNEPIPEKDVSDPIEPEDKPT